jgi:hypothetical protein
MQALKQDIARYVAQRMLWEAQNMIPNKSVILVLQFSNYNDGDSPEEHVILWPKLVPTRSIQQLTVQCSIDEYARCPFYNRHKMLLHVNNAAFFYEDLDDQSDDAKQVAAFLRNPYFNLRKLLLPFIDPETRTACLYMDQHHNLTVAQHPQREFSMKSVIHAFHQEGVQFEMYCISIVHYHGTDEVNGDGVKDSSKLIVRCHDGYEIMSSVLENRQFDNELLNLVLEHAPGIEPGHYHCLDYYIDTDHFYYLGTTQDFSLENDTAEEV